jgi:hypothetical protein
VTRTDITAEAEQDRRRRVTRPDLTAAVSASTGAQRALSAGVVLALLLAVALRFLSTSQLWLDEALSLNIATLPIPEMLAALANDGHPPLYYLLLHAWSAVFGEGNFAVRSLSGVFSVGSLAAMWFVGRRLGGTTVAWAACLLLGLSPFAVRYATEARMYALVVLLTLLGLLAYLWVRDRPTLPRLTALGLLSGALLLTHYWAFFLLAVAGAMVLVMAVRGTDRSSARRALIAMVAGAGLFVPWLPTFLTQLSSTGTPWGAPGGLSAVPAALGSYAGGINSAPGLLLGITFFGLAAFGALGRPIDNVRIEIDLRGRPVARELFVLVVATLVLAIVVGQVTGSAYSSRYTAVTLGPFILLVALGARVMASPAIRRGVLGVALVLGAIASAPLVTDQRTQAVEVAAAINSRAEPGDVVVYCPDQLGPATERLLRDDLRALPFPAAGDPRFVDWTDYGERNQRSSGTAFAASVDELAGADQVFVVYAPNYATLGTRCEILVRELAARRAPGRSVSSARVVALDPGQFYEASELYAFP